MTDHKLRKVLPRRSLRDADNALGTYPTVARTGDLRTGKLNSWFDDLGTPVFTTSSVSAPTMLPIGSPNLLPDLTSSITTQRVVPHGVIEPWMRVARKSENIMPFKEVGHFEQDYNKSSSSYLTGSSIYGFTQNLGSKTALRFEFPISQQTFLDPLTASVYYFNPLIGAFDEVAPQLKQPPSMAYIQGSYGSAYFYSTESDVKFFDCYGNYAISGSYIDQVPFSIFDYSTYISQLLLRDEKQSVLRNPTYAANVSQSLKLDFINQPFLLERAVVEMPFQAGPGWAKDRTQMGQRISLISNPVPYYRLGMGGPAITFAISNQLRPDRRELILSASIIPDGDNYGRIDTIPGLATVNYLSGFSDLAQPTCVVPTTASSMFTGSIRFEAYPMISAGGQLTSFANNVGGLTQLPYSGAFPGNPRSGTPFGRAGDGTATGRSIFGRERSVPNLSYVPPIVSKYNYIPPVGQSVGIVSNFKRNAYSPYLLLPGDNLVISISKYHAAMSSSAGNQPLPQMPLLNEHDVLIPPGVMRITLYGSLVKNMKEFHDTLNTEISSDAVHQAIGFEACLDQYDLEHRTLYSGSYTDVYITGSFVINPNTGTILRGVLGSSVAADFLFSDPQASLRNTSAYEVKKNNHYIQAISANERYFDSLLPAIAGVVNLDGGLIYDFNFNGFLASAGSAAVVTLDDSTQPTYSDNTWTKAFPFEPRYSTVSRLLRAESGFAYTQVFNGSWSNVSGIASSFMVNLNSNHVPGSPFYERVNFPVSLKIPTLIPNAQKFFFGFGDRNTFPTYQSPSPGSWSTFGSTNFVDCSSDGTKPLIRGWKYGIYNAFPTFTRAHWRRNRFGQVRDMLEQRQDTTFYETIGYKSDGTRGGTIGKLVGPIAVRFVDKNGNTLPPDQTTSCNLSTAATSSLPYFDGDMRNRPPIFGPTAITALAPLLI